jgi:hypothetical protein
MTAADLVRVLSGSDGWSGGSCAWCASWGSSLPALVSVVGEQEVVGPTADTDTSRPCRWAVEAWTGDMLPVRTVSG